MDPKFCCFPELTLKVVIYFITFNEMILRQIEEAEIFISMRFDISVDDSICLVDFVMPAQNAYRRVEV